MDPDTNVEEENKDFDQAQRDSFKPPSMSFVRRPSTADSEETKVQMIEF